MLNELLRSHCVTKSYPMGSGRLEVLRGLDFTIQRGEAVCIVGASGAGKSTFLHILGTLDQPTLGRVSFAGQDLTRQSEAELAYFRNTNLGFVFQFHHLLNEFTAVENVMMPLLVAGQNKLEARESAATLLETLGLKERLEHFPSELSGGEKQRVAIARALIRKPIMLLADEPTGNLDTHNSKLIQDLFFDLKKRLNLTLITVTHDMEFAKRFSRVLTMKDGLWESP